MLVLRLLMLMAWSGLLFILPVKLSNNSSQSKESDHLTTPCRMLNDTQCLKERRTRLARRQAYGNRHPEEELILKEYYNHMVRNHWPTNTTTTPAKEDLILGDEVFANVSSASEILRNLSFFCSRLVTSSTAPTTPIEEDIHDDKLPTVEVYGYGTLAVLIISFCSLAGLICLPMIQWSAYRHMITGFIALGLGVMMGDAVLHLIPEALLVSRAMKDDPYLIWRCLLIMATVYGLFTFESIMELIHHQDDASHRCPRRHSHSHIPFPEDFAKPSMPRPLIKPKSSTLLPAVSDVSSSIAPYESGISDSESVDQEKIRKSKVEFHPCEMEPCETAPYKGWKTLALVIIMGDTIHNFGDGLAVGAAFTSGAKSGISTSAAIFCHELPHEFGDFVILMTSGLTFRRALIVNLSSAITAFVGLYVGIFLGNNEMSRRWIFAFTAGTFIYIAIGDMLPELRNHNKCISVFIVQNICMVLGMGLMVVVTIYEHGIISYL